jgi:hypothetical protein
MKVFVIVIFISVWGIKTYGQVSNKEALKYSSTRVNATNLSLPCCQ